MADNRNNVGGTNIEGADIGVIVAYFAVVMAFGIWSSCKNRGSVGGYFLAGRSMHFILIGASLFASNIGSGHFIGLAGSGASSGIGIAVFELNAIFILMILGWVFVPVYIASGVFTMPEYLRKRFGGQRIRVYLAVLAVLLSIFTKVSADLYAGAVFIEAALGWDLYAAIVLLLAIAAIFTIAGGLTAVIWTDFIQTIIMLIGGIYLMIVTMIKIGGYEGLKAKWPQSYPNMSANSTVPLKCVTPSPYAFNLFRPVDDPLPWPGVVFGLTISGLWYWCTDQVIVQRALASKNLTHAKAGTVLAGFLKIFPMWLIVVPGMISRILFPDTIACAEPDLCEEICGIRTGCTNIAYPTLVIELLPVGARGLMLAVMMSALMSSLTSIFNSSSTIFTMDIWTRIRKNASDMELLIVGRVFVLAMVGIGIAWIPIVKNFSELFHYIQSVTSYLAPPICAVYVLAVLWKRTNEQGAFWGLMIGLAIGLTRFIWESVYPAKACGEESSKPDILSKMHYLHFGILLWGIVTICTIVISLLTKPMDEEHLVRLTFFDRYNTAERLDIDEHEKQQQDLNENMEMREKGGADNPGYNSSGSQDLTQGSSASQVNIEPEPEESEPWYKIAVNWICGIEKHPELVITEEERKQLEKENQSLDEVPLWRNVTNVAAIFLMVVATFIWGFFA